MPDPKTVLHNAQKQLAAAKDALAESDRIARYLQLLEKDEMKLVDTADLEDRGAMRQLADNQAQKLVIPRRIEQCAAKQTAAGLTLIETSDSLSRTTAELLEQEATARLDEWEKKMLPDCPNYTESNGEVRKTAREIAGRLGIFYHLSKRADASNGVPGLLDASRCHNEPAEGLSSIIEHVERQLLILHEYFANGKTFRDPNFGKAA